MTALVLCDLGVAILQRGEEYYLYRPDADEQASLLTNYERSQILALNPEVASVVYNSTEALSAIIKEKRLQHEILENTLSLMDLRLSEAYRKEMMEVVGVQLLNPSLYNFVNHRLLSSILPEGFSPRAAYGLFQKDQKYEAVATLFLDLDKKSDILRTFLSKLAIRLNLETAQFLVLIDEFAEADLLFGFVDAIYKRSRGNYDAVAKKAITILHRSNISEDLDFFVDLVEQFVVHPVKSSPGNSTYNVSFVGERRPQQVNKNVNTRLSQHSVKDDNEETLMGLFRDGSKEAFFWAFDRMTNPLSLFVENIIHSPNDTEDIVANAFYKLFLVRSGMKSYEHVKRWLYVVVRNETVDLVRLRAKHRESNGVLAGFEVGFDDKLEAERAKAVLFQDILDEIEKLPRQRKTILRLYFFEQKTTSEIAEMMQLNTQTVLNHKAKGLQSLKNSGLKLKWLF